MERLALEDVPVVQSRSFFQAVTLPLQKTMLVQSANAIFNQNQGRTIFLKIKTPHHFNLVAFHVE